MYIPLEIELCKKSLQHFLLNTLGDSVLTDIQNDINRYLATRKPESRQHLCEVCHLVDL